MRKCITLNAYDRYNSSEKTSEVYINPDTVTMIEPGHSGGARIVFTNGEMIYVSETSEEARNFIFPDIQLSDLFNMPELALSVL